MGEPIRCLEATNGQEPIRLYDARRASTGGPRDLSGALTLSEFVERYYKPVHLVMADARPRNLEAIDESVAYWVRFTGDPRLDEIGVFHSRDFVVGLKSLPGKKYATLANNTVRKHCAAVQAILDLCGRPSRDQREALGILDEVPYIARPPKQKPAAEGGYSLEELIRLMENADAAEQPRKIHGRPINTGDYHRRIYALIFNTGVRIGGVMTMTWSHFHGDHLILPARVAVKGHEDKRLELNDQARSVIEAMRGYHAERIFPWPYSWPGSRGNLYRRGHRLICQCLPPERRDDYAYHDLRKLHNYLLAGINNLACMKSLGHSNWGTTVDHYTPQKLVADTVAKLPPLSLNGNLQQQLF